jgi:hypothetical protein
MVTPYEQPMANGRGVRTYGGQPHYGTWDGKRFLFILKKKTRKLHRLICEAFNGPAGEDEVCMHLDEDSSNNHPSNLCWGTQKENLNAPGFVEYCRSRTGDNSSIRKGMVNKATLAVTDKGGQT